MKKILLALSFSFIAASGWATNGYIQSASCNSNGTSVSCAFGKNVTAGNTLVVSCVTGFGTVYAATDTVSNVYTAAGSVLTDHGGNQMGTYYVVGAIGGATTVVCHTTQALIQALIAEYASSTTAGGFDVTASSAPTSSLAFVTSSSATLTATNDLVVEDCADMGTGTFTGQTGTTRENYVNNFYQMSQDAVVASAGPYASTFSIGSPAGWACAEVAFKQNAPVRGGTITIQ